LLNASEAAPNIATSSAPATIWNNKEAVPFRNL